MLGCKLASYVVTVTAVSTATRKVERAGAELPPVLLDAVGIVFTFCALASVEVLEALDFLPRVGRRANFHF